MDAILDSNMVLKRVKFCYKRNEAKLQLKTIKVLSNDVFIFLGPRLPVGL